MLYWKSASSLFFENSFICACANETIKKNQPKKNTTTRDEEKPEFNDDNSKSVTLTLCVVLKMPYRISNSKTSFHFALFLPETHIQGTNYKFFYFFLFRFTFEIITKQLQNIQIFIFILKLMHIFFFLVFNLAMQKTKKICSHNFNIVNMQNFLQSTHLVVFSRKLHW